MSDSNVIIKVTTSFYPVFINVNKFIGHLNHHISEYMYVEHIDKGFLYIFKDMNSFLRVVSPLKKKITEISKSLPSYQKINNQSLFQGALHGLKYPSSGITITYEFITQNTSEMIKPIEKYFESVHKDIKITIISEKNIEIKFPTLETGKSYANALLYSLRIKDF
ncbi:MAG: hypothetical protein ACTSXH_07620 [Promethearchaeota archaeon]